MSPKRLIKFFPRLLASSLFAVAVGNAKAESNPAAIPPMVAELVETFNDEEIPFNDKLITIGRADAPATGILILGLSENSSYLMKRVIPDLEKKYAKSGKVKFVIIELPLTWHDMQAFAGFRCVSSDKHWEVMQNALSYPRDHYQMKQASYLNAPGYIWSMMKGYGVERAQAEKCMRNNAIVGHVEGQRRLIKESWGIDTAPSFVIGETVLTNPTSEGPIISAIENYLEGSKNEK